MYISLNFLTIISFILNYLVFVFIGNRFIIIFFIFLLSLKSIFCLVLVFLSFFIFPIVINFYIIFRFFSLLFCFGFSFKNIIKNYNKLFVVYNLNIFVVVVFYLSFIN